MHVQWRPQCRPRACLSGDVNSKLSLYFNVSRAPRAFCRCLPFNLEMMAAVSVTVFEENKVLCWGRHLRISDLDMLLLSMLQGLLSTLESSESIAGWFHLVFTAASAEGICLDEAPDDKVSLHMEFWRSHVFFNLRSPSHLEDADPTASSSQPACTINGVLLEAASETRLPAVPKSGLGNIAMALDTLTPSFLAYKISEEKRLPTRL